MVTASQFSSCMGDFATLKGVLVGVIDVAPFNKFPTKELVEEVNMVSCCTASDTKT